MSAGLFLTIWLIVGIVGLSYLLRHQVRWYWRTNVKNRDLPPHQRWPEIINWREGDEFEGGDFHCNKLVSICEDGYAVVSWLGKQRYAHLSRLVGCNASARTRRISARLAQSNEYMELLNEFNKAIDELKRRDKQRGIAA